MILLFMAHLPRYPPGSAMGNRELVAWEVVERRIQDTFPDRRKSDYSGMTFVRMFSAARDS